MLSITGNALVDTQTSEQPDDCSWDDVGDAALTMADHLSHKLYTRPRPELAAIAAEPAQRRGRWRRRGRIIECTHDSLRYVRGVTGVHTSANEAYADGAGVCQDFAHLALALAKIGRAPLAATSRATSTPKPTPPSARRSRARATPGSRSGPASGGGTTPPTTRGRGASRRGRPRARLLRRAAGQGDLCRQRREHHAGGGAHDKDALSCADRPC